MGSAFPQARGWTITDFFEDQAITGTVLKKRPGMQALRRLIKERDVDIVFCMSVDRISRDIEHSSGILEQLRHQGTELWDVKRGAPVSDLELGIHAAISHDLIENVRYKTREGMKTTVRKGKAAGGIAYGYRMKLEHDDKFNRIAGLREIDPDQADVVRWIFQQYALGRSPQDMAIELNNREPFIAGPRGLLWRDTAIRGHRDRGSGILNNETYVGPSHSIAATFARIQRRNNERLV